MNENNDTEQSSTPESFQKDEYKNLIAKRAAVTHGHESNYLEASNDNVL